MRSNLLEIYINIFKIILNIMIQFKIKYKLYLINLTPKHKYYLTRYILRYMKKAREEKPKPLLQFPVMVPVTSYLWV